MNPVFIIITETETQILYHQKDQVRDQEIL